VSLDHLDIPKHNVVLHLKYYKLPDYRQYLSVLLADLVLATFIMPSQYATWGFQYSFICENCV